MNINTKEEIGLKFDSCAIAFGLLQAIAKINQSGFIKINEKGFSLTKVQSHSDREIIKAVSSLLERALICPGYVPNKDTLTKLHNSVVHFIDQSKELSSAENMHAYEHIYLKEFLLKVALNKKVKLAEKIGTFQTITAKSASRIQSLLHVSIDHFSNADDNDDLDYLDSAKNYLYVTQKMLASTIEHQKRLCTYLNEDGNATAEGKIRAIPKKAKDPSAVFTMILKPGDNLFNDMSGLALRMRTQRIINKDCLKRGDTGALLEHIKFLLDLKSKDPSKTAQVDACLSLIRCWNLSGGDKTTKGLPYLYDDSIVLYGAAQLLGGEIDTADPSLAHSRLVELYLRSFGNTELKFDNCFRNRKIELFNKGKKEELSKMIFFTQSKKKILWPLLESYIKHYGNGANETIALYKEIQEKIYQILRKNPGGTSYKPQTIRNLTHRWKFEDDEGKTHTFLDLSPEEYVARAEEIANYAKPPFIEVDAIVEQAKAELQDEKEQKLVASVQSLSLKNQKAQPQAPSKNRQPKKQQAKQQSLKTDKVATNSIFHETPQGPETGIVLMQDTHPEGDMQVVGKGGRVQRTHPKMVHSPFIYHPRVTRWWSNNPKDDPFLHDEEYTCREFSQDVKDLIYAKHNFGLIVDQFAKREGIHSEEDGQLSLIGEITIGGKTLRGVFGYAHGTCKKNKDLYYHRFFTEKTSSKIIMEYANRGGYKLDISEEDRKAPKQVVKGKTTSLADDGSFVQNITDDVIVISDPKNKMMISLCRFLDKDTE